MMQRAMCAIEDEVEQDFRHDEGRNPNRTKITPANPVVPGMGNMNS